MSLGRVRGIFPRERSFHVAFDGIERQRIDRLGMERDGCQPERSQRTYRSNRNGNRLQRNVLSDLMDGSRRFERAGRTGRQHGAQSPLTVRARVEFRRFRPRRGTRFRKSAERDAYRLGSRQQRKRGNGYATRKRHIYRRLTLLCRWGRMDTMNPRLIRQFVRSGRKTHQRCPTLLRQGLTPRKNESRRT